MIPWARLLARHRLSKAKENLSLLLLRSLTTTSHNKTVPSPYNDVSIPQLSIYEHVYDRFDFYGDNVALVDATSLREVTFSQLKETTRKVSSGLRRHGFKKGDALLLFSPNSVDYPTVFFAALAAGGVVTTCNPSYTARELHHQVMDSGCKYVASAPELVSTVLKAIEGTSVEKVVILQDGDQPQREKGIVSLRDLVEDSGSLYEVAKPDCKRDVAVLPYSSGTTGLPKGVMLSHYNIVSNMCQLHHPQIQRYSDGEVLASVLPFFHIYGMAVVMFSALHQGKKQVVFPKFEPNLFLQSIEKHKISWAHLVPPLVLFLAKHHEVLNHDLSSLKMIISGAAPLGGDVLETVRSRTGVEMFRQAYGLTETSPVVHYSPLDLGNDKPRSVGPPVPNQSTKIVDVGTGTELGPNEEGELVVKGPNVMLGYYNRPDATKQGVTEDGWFHTGDVGYRDDWGDFYVTDRLKELIKVKGYQVAPAELEELLVLHPKIVDAAVIGVPHERMGEAPRAFVVRSDSSLSEEEVAGHVRESLAEYKWLEGGVEFIKEIPKSASGKILRRELK